MCLHSVSISTASNKNVHTLTTAVNIVSYENVPSLAMSIYSAIPIRMTLYAWYSLNPD